MVKRIELAPPSQERFGNPTPLGLLGLAIACGALVPIAFGHSLTPAGLKTGAMWALLFGGGCQLLSGLMSFANKNVFGGTIFTAFSFLWANNAWGLYAISQGTVPDHAIGLSIEVVLLAIFLVLTYGFGFFARLLFIFLVDIDLLFFARVVRSLSAVHVLGPEAGVAMNLPVALFTIGLGAIGLWLAFGTLINPLAGRAVFPMGGPVFFAPKKDVFDWTLRRTIFEVLYSHWSRSAFRELSFPDLEAKVQQKVPGRDLHPELVYLAELGYVKITTPDADPHAIDSARLTAHGVDIHEQLVLQKYALPSPLSH